MENPAGRLWRWFLDAVVAPPPPPPPPDDQPLDLRIWDNAGELLDDEFAHSD